MTVQQQEYFTELAAQAEANGASRLQIDALHEAAATGELTTDMVTGLYDPLFECFAVLGAEGEVFGTKEAAPGIVVPDYRVNFDAEFYAEGGEELQAAVTACETVHAGYVWQAMFLQPKAIEARDSQQLTMLPQIRECLAEVGIELSEDPKVYEVDDAIGEARQLGRRCNPEAIEMGITDATVD